MSPRTSVRVHRAMKQRAASIRELVSRPLVRRLFIVGTGTSYWSWVMYVGTPWAKLDLVFC